MSQPGKRSTVLSLDKALVDEARNLGIDVSQVVEDGIVAAVRAELARRATEGNDGAIADYNAFIEAHGVPLAEFRKF